MRTHPYLIVQKILRSDYLPPKSQHCFSQIYVPSPAILLRSFHRFSFHSVASASIPQFMFSILMLSPSPPLDLYLSQNSSMVAFIRSSRGLYEETITTGPLTSAFAYEPNNDAIASMVTIIRWICDFRSMVIIDFLIHNLMHRAQHTRTQS